MSIKIDIWNEIEWIEVSSMEGTFCDYVKKVDKAYKNIRQATIPPLDENCITPAVRFL